MSLLTLPTELRHEIYSYLTSNPKRLPFGDLSVDEISHRPPPTALQRACRFLYNDTTTYFYYITTIHVEFTATNIIKNPRALATLRSIRSVHFHMTWCDDEWYAHFGAIKPGNWSIYMAREDGYHSPPKQRGEVSEEIGRVDSGASYMLTR